LSGRDTRSEDGDIALKATHGVVPEAICRGDGEFKHLPGAA
jgi:hypothetical protein